MPATFDALAALLVGPRKVCKLESELDVLLKELEGRGLIGWDKVANRYDLHPVVRGVVWNSISDPEKQKIYRSLRKFFQDSPQIDPNQIKSLDDLTGSIELYNAVVGLGQYDK